MLRKKGPWGLGHYEDRDLTVPSPEKAKQAKWLFHLFLCSCSYGHSASTHSPYSPSLLLWIVTLQVAALSTAQRTRTAFVEQLLYLSAPFSLALHNLSSAGHRAQPDTPALGLQLTVTMAKELGILSHSGMAAPQGSALPSCQLKFCLSCQEDKLVVGTQDNTVIAHAPLLAVTHLGNIFWLQIPKSQGKSR